MFARIGPRGERVVSRARRGEDAELEVGGRNRGESVVVVDRFDGHRAPRRERLVGARLGSLRAEHGDPAQQRDRAQETAAARASVRDVLRVRATSRLALRDDLFVVPPPPPLPAPRFPQRVQRVQMALGGGGDGVFGGDGASLGFRRRRDVHSQARRERRPRLRVRLVPAPDVVRGGFGDGGAADALERAHLYVLGGVRQGRVDDQRPTPEVCAQKRAVQRVAAKRTRNVPRVIRRHREHQARVRQRRHVQLLVRLLFGFRARTQKTREPSRRRKLLGRGRVRVVSPVAAFTPTLRGVFASLLGGSRGIARPRTERVLRRAVLDHLAHVLLHELVVVQGAVVVVLETLVTRVVVVVLGLVVVVAGAAVNAAADASRAFPRGAAVRPVQTGHLEPGQTRVGLGVAHRGEHRGERAVGFLAPRLVPRDASLRLRLDRRANHRAQILDVKKPGPVHLRRGHGDGSGGLVAHRQLHAQRIRRARARVVRLEPFIGHGNGSSARRRRRRVVVAARRRRTRRLRRLARDGLFFRARRRTRTVRTHTGRDDVHERRGEHGCVRRRSMSRPGHPARTLAHGDALAVDGARRHETVQRLVRRYFPGKGKGVVEEGFGPPLCPSAERDRLDIRRRGVRHAVVFVTRTRIRLVARRRRFLSLFVRVAFLHARRDGAPTPARGVRRPRRVIERKRTFRRRLKRLER